MSARRLICLTCTTQATTDLDLVVARWYHLLRVMRKNKTHDLNACTPAFTRNSITRLSSYVTTFTVLCFTGSGQHQIRPHLLSSGAPPRGEQRQGTVTFLRLRPRLGVLSMYPSPPPSHLVMIQSAIPWHLRGRIALCVDGVASDCAHREQAEEPPAYSAAVWPWPLRLTTLTMPDCVYLDLRLFLAVCVAFRGAD